VERERKEVRGDKPPLAPPLLCFTGGHTRRLLLRGD
jgi:hypothetical protein